MLCHEEPLLAQRMYSLNKGLTSLLGRLAQGALLTGAATGADGAAGSTVTEVAAGTGTALG